MKFVVEFSLFGKPINTESKRNWKIKTTRKGIIRHQKWFEFFRTQQWDSRPKDKDIRTPNVSLSELVDVLKQAEVEIIVDKGNYTMADGLHPYLLDRSMNLQLPLKAMSLAISPTIVPRPICLPNRRGGLDCTQFDREFDMKLYIWFRLPNENGEATVNVIAFETNEEGRWEPVEKQHTWSRRLDENGMVEVTERMRSTNEDETNSYPLVKQWGPCIEGDDSDAMLHRLLNIQAPESEDGFFLPKIIMLYFQRMMRELPVGHDRFMLLHFKIFWAHLLLSLDPDSSDYCRDLNPSVPTTRISRQFFYTYVICYERALINVVDALRYAGLHRFIQPPSKCFQLPLLCHLWNHPENEFLLHDIPYFYPNAPSEPLQDFVSQLRDVLELERRH